MFLCGQDVFMQKRRYVFSLKSIVLIPRHPDYAGCRSWVTLDSPLETQGIKPVLSDADFKKHEDLLTRLLEN